MGKFYLNVPYNEKDIAKRQGARWDQDKKKGFVPENIDSLAFIKWVTELNPENNYNLYSEHDFIGECMDKCSNCKKNILLYTF